VRLYDSRFLLVLGQLQELHNAEPQDGRKTLVAADLLLGAFIVDSEENQKSFGLNEATIRAAKMALTFVRPLLNEQDFGRDVNAFNAWKALFISALGHFESALSLNIEALKVFVLEPKRGLSVDVLLSKIEETLPETDRNMVSKFCRNNMQEAGACLAFHRFTACGYHMARAVEDVARRYNFAVTGHPSPYTDKNGETRHRALAQIAGELQQVLDNWKHANDPRLLTLIVPTLRSFCRIYRTPLSHADPTLEELGPDDAEIAFGHAITAISTMLEDGRAGGPHFQQPCVWQ